MHLVDKRFQRQLQIKYYRRRKYHYLFPSHLQMICDSDLTSGGYWIEHLKTEAPKSQIKVNFGCTSYQYIDTRAGDPRDDEGPAKHRPGRYGCKSEGRGVARRGCYPCLQCRPIYASLELVSCHRNACFESCLTISGVGGGGITDRFQAVTVPWGNVQYVPLQGLPRPASGIPSLIRDAAMRLCRGRLGRSPRKTFVRVRISKTCSYPPPPRPRLSSNDARNKSIPFSLVGAKKH